jgi:hypothetical protein
MKWFINIVSKYLFIGEIVLFITQNMYKLLIRRILFGLTQKSAFYFSLIRILSKIPGFSSILSALCINDKRLETEVFGLKFKKSSRTCSWIW